MQLATVATAVLCCAAAVARAQGSIEDWRPPGHGEARGPCPALNTLANHGFLPRDGGNITLANAVHAMGAAFNFDPALSKELWSVVERPNNASYFTLESLRQHNKSEHDGSLSRPDKFDSPNDWWTFDPAVFAFTRSFWTADPLDRDQLVRSWAARHEQARRSDPDYWLAGALLNTSLVELAAPIASFGDIAAVTVSKPFVEYFFENERLPSELGWQRSDRLVTADDVKSLSMAVGEAARKLAAEVAGSDGGAKAAAAAAEPGTPRGSRHGEL